MRYWWKGIYSLCIVHMLVLISVIVLIKYILTQRHVTIGLKITDGTHQRVFLLVLLLGGISISISISISFQKIPLQDIGN